MTLPRRTLLCSPYAGDIQRNTHYARDCMKDSLDRGEAPFLSHLLYTQVLIDAIPEERTLGMLCEDSWLRAAEQIVFYCDLGFTPGMEGVRDSLFARQHNIRMLSRTLGEPWSR